MKRIRIFKRYLRIKESKQHLELLRCQNMQLFKYGFPIMDTLQYQIDNLRLAFFSFKIHLLT